MYLYALLPFFTFLASSGRGVERAWDRDAEAVRNAVAEYLEDHLHCSIRRHRFGFDLVQVSGRTRSNVGALLAAFKLFYLVMREVGCYAAENPLVDVALRVAGDIEEGDRGNTSNDPPRMPDVSGVEPVRSHRRLTDSFFKLVGKEWVPQIIDDPTFTGLARERWAKVARLGLARRVRNTAVI